MEWYWWIWIACGIMTFFSLGYRTLVERKTSFGDIIDLIIITIISPLLIIALLIFTIINVATEATNYLKRYKS